MPRRPTLAAAVVLAFVASVLTVPTLGAAEEEGPGVRVARRLLLAPEERVGPVPAG